MKKYRITILFAVLLSGVLFCRCDVKDFGDINLDPNSPSLANTSFLFLGASRQGIPPFYLTGTYDPWGMIYCQYLSERTNIQFTNFSGLDYVIGGFYTGSLKYLTKIIELNSDPETMSETYVTGLCNSNINQIAVARTLKAYIFMHLTDVVGMIPYSEALQAKEGNYKPKYDDQQSIYTDLNKELEEAYTQFVESAPLNSQYDIFYNGDIAKWKRFNASVRMQLAIKLFKADPGSGQTRFAKAYGDGFIRSNADIFLYPYLNESNNQNPFYDNVVVSARRDFQPSGTLIDTLLKYQDPRISAYAVTNAYGDYFGMPFGLDRNGAAQYALEDVSQYNPKHYAQNAPGVLITPSITLLAAAEAAERGWISASAQSLYEEAITAALSQHGFTGSDVTDYLAQPDVAYKTGGTQAERLAQIAMQKWLASYMQDSMEAFADWRRFGVPVLEPGEFALVDAIPRRRMYGSTDYNANPENYNAAIAAQGPDLMTTRVWWDK